MKITLTTLLFTFIFLRTKAQIFVQRATDEAITITPKGIQSKFTNTVPTANTLVGAYAGTFLNSSTGLGNYNTAVGYLCLQNTTTGHENTALGMQSLKNNTTGYYNVALGQSTLITNVGNFGSTAVGFGAMAWCDDRETGRLTHNTAVGYYALKGSVNYSNNSGLYNSAVGSNSLLSNTTGENNVAFGYWSLVNNNTGSNNVAIGTQALVANTTGANNTVVGYQAGTQTNGSNNIFIGYKAGYFHPTANNLLVIENSDATQALIRGDFTDDKVGINRTKNDLDANSFTFQVNGDASKNSAGNWSSHSDRRLKKNISYLNSQEVLQKVLNLKGVTYEWNDTKTGTKRPAGLQFGFIAQEIKEVFPTKIQEDKNGYLMTAYGDYDPIFVESIKALKELIDEQRKEINYLKNKVEILSTENKQQAKLSEK